MKQMNQMSALKRVVDSLCQRSRRLIQPGPAARPSELEIVLDQLLNVIRGLRLEIKNPQRKLPLTFLLDLHYDIDECRSAVLAYQYNLYGKYFDDEYEPCCDEYEPCKNFGVDNLNGN